jgi:lantibiotic leader peptide-processing serine protease
VEVPGVIGVSAVGNRLQDSNDPGSGYLKSFYSSFGVGLTEVTAPGGDSIFGVTPAAINGRVLSTYPANRPCARQVLEGTTKYCYLQGTSMASPHAAGVAALLISRFGPMSASKVKALLSQTADSQPCPATLPTGYAAILGVDDEQVQICQGGKGSNSWYGRGVNALTAVTSH